MMVYFRLLRDLACSSLPKSNSRRHTASTIYSVYSSQSGEIVLRNLLDAAKDMGVRLRDQPSTSVLLCKLASHIRTRTLHQYQRVFAIPSSIHLKPSFTIGNKTRSIICCSVKGDRFFWAHRRIRSSTSLLGRGFRPFPTFLS